VVTDADLARTAEALGRLRRKMRVYTYALVAATALAVLGGAALIAWLLRPTGLPFWETWLVSGVLILVVPAVGLALQRLRGRRENDGSGGSGQPRAGVDETD
jgi:membrane protein implicated in regulation of membrane protease activity